MTNTIQRDALDVVCGGSFKGAVDTVASAVYPKWKQMDCASRANMLGEAANFGVFAGTALAGVAATRGRKGGAALGLGAGATAGNLIHGVARQAAFVGYNEACKAEAH